MSIQINLNEFSEELLSEVQKPLQINIKDNFKVKTIYALDVIKDEKNASVGYIPFAHGVKYFPRPNRSLFQHMLSPEFKGELRPEQVEIKTEAIQKLNATGSTIISAYPGFGKCLGLNTPVLMFDGTIKKVQHVIKGDLLMGDDSTSRTVESVCTGVEQMYRIQQSNGDFFTCNKSHILSLKLSNHKTITRSDTRGYIVRELTGKNIKKRFFDSHEKALNYSTSVKSDGILDISVEDYFLLSKQFKSKLRLFKMTIDFQHVETPIHPYFIGVWVVCGHRENNKTFLKIQDKIKTRLLSKSNSNIHFVKEAITEESGNTCSAYSFELDSFELSDCCLAELPAPAELPEIDSIPLLYKANSKEVRLEILAAIIDTCGYHFKHYYEIFHYKKKIIEDSKYIAQSLGFYCTSHRTFFQSKIMHILVIYGKNIKSIPSLHSKKIVNKHFYHENQLLRFGVIPIRETEYYGFALNKNHRFLLGDFTVTHNTITSLFIATKIKLKTMIICNRLILIDQWKTAIQTFCPESSVGTTPESDFFIMNAINVSKQPRDYYKDVGFVIIDEVHLIMSEVLSKSLLHLTPRYLLGLSATPYREDELDILLTLYFGEDKIFRKMERDHLVYKLTTTFTPDVEMQPNGKVNWCSVLESQSSCESRNELIVKLVSFFKDRVFLILCKRVAQSKHLVQRLTELNEDVTSLIGKEQEYEHSSRILVGTTGKCSVGFDHPRLNTLLLATDIKSYFIQVLGRIFRTRNTDTIPLVIDIVDKNPILYQHFKVRQSVYNKHGGKIVDFKKAHPSFTHELI